MSTTGTFSAHEISAAPTGWGTCRCCPGGMISRCRCGEWFCPPHGNEHLAGHHLDRTDAADAHHRGETR